MISAVRRHTLVFATAGTVLLAAPLALAQINVPGQDWDGSLTITANTTIDLAQAITGDWNVQPTDAAWQSGDGVFDATQWAIVYHYTDVTIGAGVTLDFANHSSGAPVVWLVTGNVTIDGTLSLSGETGNTAGFPSLPGPGAFRGGNGLNLGIPRSGGFGPGGASTGLAQDGSYATSGNGGAPTYGSSRIVPLIGGSGGAGNAGSAGAGGGAILIACAGNVRVDGTINARGGNRGDNGGGAGSGGAIRIVADSVTVDGSLLATGGFQTAGEGRIRVESASLLDGAGAIFPSPSLVLLSAGATAQIWPEATDPSLRILSLNGLPIPDDPQATFTFPWQDEALDGANGAITVRLEGTNVPSDATVNVFVTRTGGDRIGPLPATFLSSGGNVSTWELALTDVPNGLSAIQARAVLP
ncbi:MAG: hypothetical protein KC591_07415 [Gemmatimonadetes bacterium]|nr:hypothetical protein [Gemmatimonadota bacterium]